MCIQTANLDYVFGNNTVTFNGSYSVGDSECVVVTVSAPRDNLVEGTEYFIANIYTLDIQVFIFIVDRDCETLDYYFIVSHLP